MTDDATLRARSSGRVMKPESYNYRTFLPEKKGLYCAEIFGSVPWASGDPAAMASDDRSERWGHIELPAPMRRADRASRSVILVLPPVYRRFVVQTPEESRAHARARRAQLIALAASDAWPHCDPLETLLAEEGLETEAQVEAREGGMMEPRIGGVYRRIVNLSNRLVRYAELNAPEHVRAEDRETLRDACDWLDREIVALALPPEIEALALGR